MRCVVVGFLASVGVLLAGCSVEPTKEALFAREAQSLQYYCASNAAVAEAALRDCAQYAEQCQQAGVEGIPYNEVFARIYGRLYLLERHLGNSAAAEECLQKYARYHAASSTLARRTGRPHGEMVRLIEQKYDGGLQAAWKTNTIAKSTSSSQARH